MCRGRLQTQRLRSSFPNCVCSQNHHCTRRRFCIFTHELGTCSEGPICQGDPRTVSVPGSLDPMGITSQSIRGTSSGAVQTFITLILQGTEQTSSMLSISGAWAAQECPSLFWGIKLQNSNCTLVCCTLRMVTCEGRPFASNKGVLAELVVSMRQCLADRHFLARLAYCPIASNLQRG